MLLSKILTSRFHRCVATRISDSVFIMTRTAEGSQLYLWKEWQASKYPVRQRGALGQPSVWFMSLHFLSWNPFCWWASVPWEEKACLLCFLSGGYVGVGSASPRTPPEIRTPPLLDSSYFQGRRGWDGKNRAVFCFSRTRWVRKEWVWVFRTYQGWTGEKVIETIQDRLASSQRESWATSYQTSNSLQEVMVGFIYAIISPLYLVGKRCAL